MSFELNLCLEIVIFYSISILLIKYLIKENYAILVLIFSWWFFWNLISNSGIGYYFKINYFTQIIYFLFFASIILGIYFQKRSKSIFLYKFFKIENSNVISKKIELLNKFLIFVVFPITLQFLIRSIYLQITKYDQVYFRGEVFGLHTGRSELFYNSITIAYFYWLCIYPFYWVALIVGVSNFVVNNRYKLLVTAIILFVMDSILTVGRFGIHYSLFTLITLFILKFDVFRKLDFKNKIKFGVIISLSALLFLVLLFSVRNAGSIYKSIFLSLIGYHIASFTIFDLELNNIHSIIHDHTFGLSFFSGIFNLPSFVLSKYFNIHFLSNFFTMGGYLHANRYVGFHPELGKIHINAFGSIFFSMYRDGGLLFISIFGVSFGYLISFLITGIRKKNEFMVSILFCLFYTLIYGIFKLFTDGEILPAIVIIIVLFKFYFKPNTAYQE
ncbi:O-antigen polymerase [Leptospira sp. GIMC2001]|uniref:O-antigen polymerase n=1 Tax=Leptospira sp. GIMC2001 TaxID=1513297 RepID=UPI00234AC85C|nr:O-antigen polymerase [Leptospira sp. GIMC2001]WCL51258.1 O-antigen ligase [Leptospira sp. GIMC2001]